MKRILLITYFAILSCFIYGQEVFPFVNTMHYLKSFQNGQSRQVDYLKPIAIQYSKEIIAYIDNKSDFIVYDGKTKEKLTGFANDFKIGINLLAWNTGPIVYAWDNGKKRILTEFGGRYEVSDSLIVFEDKKENSIKAYYNGQIYDIYYSISTLAFPQYIGSNTIAYRGNGGVHYAFIAGKTVEIGVINDPVKYSPGVNLIAFNDPYNQSFAVAFQNEVLNVEETMVESYKTGYNTIVYKDRNRNLKGYINNKMVTLSSFSSFYEVFRNMVVWGENGVFYTYVDGQRYEIANYIPENYKLRDGIIAFRNLSGGVSAFFNKQVKVISNLRDAAFQVNGNTIRVQVNKNNYMFFKNGKTYQF